MWIFLFYFIWTPCWLIQSFTVFFCCCFLRVSVNWLIDLYSVQNAGCHDSLMDWCDWMIGHGSASPEAHHCVFPASLINAWVDLMNSERSLIDNRVSPAASLFSQKCFHQINCSSQVCSGERLYGGLFKSSESYHDSRSEESLIVWERERERRLDHDRSVIHHSYTTHSLLSSAIVFLFYHVFLHH